MKARNLGADKSQETAAQVEIKVTQLLPQNHDRFLLHLFLVLPFVKLHILQASILECTSDLI